MKAIAQQLVALLAALSFLYLILLGASLLVFPMTAPSDGLDTALATHSIFMTEPKYVFLNRLTLAAVRPRVIFVGASNTVVGFKQREVAALLPRVEIDNLAVGGSNVAEVAQIVDLVKQVQDVNAQRDTTFVIGIWYGLFAENRARWYTPERYPGDTDIDIERFRYGFYRRTSAGPTPLLPPGKLAVGILLVHPYLVIDKISRDATRQIRGVLFGRAPERTDAERNATILSESEKVEALAYWQTQMQSDREIAPEQFQILRDLVGRILASGSKVVLVNLPIPRWHEYRSPFYPSYARQTAALVGHFEGKPGFTFLQMKGANDDLDFSDEVHPKPRVTPRWAERIADTLRTQDRKTGSPDSNRGSLP